MELCYEASLYPCSIFALVLLKILLGQGLGLSPMGLTIPAPDFLDFSLSVALHLGGP